MKLTLKAHSLSQMRKKKKKTLGLKKRYFKQTLKEYQQSKQVSMCFDYSKHHKTLK